MRSVMLSLLCFLAAVGSAVCSNNIVQLRPFYIVHTDVPVNVLLRPSGGSDEYRMVVDADDSFRKALKTEVRNGVLLVSMRGTFSTNRQIKLVFEMPATKLRRVEKMGANSLVVGPSFNPNRFEVLNKGTGLVWVVEMRCNRVTVNSEDAGTVSMGGLIQEVVATADGTSKVYMKDIQGHADITALEATEVYVQGPSRLKVNGKTATSASIRANGPRSCTTTRLNSFFSFPRRCSTFSMRRLPDINPTWTCNTSGSSSESTSVTRSIGSRGFSFSSTSTSVGATATASASSSASVSGSGSFSFSGSTSTRLGRFSGRGRRLLDGECEQEYILSYRGGDDR